MEFGDPSSGLTKYDVGWPCGVAIHYAKPYVSNSLRLRNLSGLAYHKEPLTRLGDR